MNKKEQKNTRRDFIEKTMMLGAAGIVGPSIMNTTKAMTMQPTRMTKDDISLAQWALVQEMRDGKWKNLDFPRIAREDFGLNGIEFVNTLFEVPTADYLNQLKKNADDHGVKMVLIMVDAEGDPCQPDRKTREQFGINHRKWIDIAQYLGCHAIRTNCRGPKDVDKQEGLKWAAESYNMLLEYAIEAKIKVVIENHGGVSDDAEWMISLMNEVDSLYFGTYPDWRNPQASYDNVEYLQKMLPWAAGMSYRNQPTEELTAKMINISKEAGYKGWYGIESSGRDEIKKGIKILKKYLELPK